MTMHFMHIYTHILLEIKIFHFFQNIYLIIRKVMHITVAKFGGSENVLTVEIASDLSLKDLKAVIEAESDFGIKADEMSLYYEGKYQRKIHFHNF